MATQDDHNEISEENSKNNVPTMRDLIITELDNRNSTVEELNIALFGNTKNPFYEYLMETRNGYVIGPKLSIMLAKFFGTDSNMYWANQQVATSICKILENEIFKKELDKVLTLEEMRNQIILDKIGLTKENIEFIIYILEVRPRHLTMRDKYTDSVQVKKITKILSKLIEP